jgi:hypothetical protein
MAVNYLKKQMHRIASIKLTPTASAGPTSKTAFVGSTARTAGWSIDQFRFLKPHEGGQR